MWIGSVLLVLGILAVAVGPVFINHEVLSGSDQLSKPTPGAMRRGLLADVWIVVQGGIAGVIGGGLLALSLVKLHHIRVLEEELESWKSPAQ